MSAINPSAVVIADKTLSAGGPAFSSNGNFFSLGPSGNLVAGTLQPGPTAVPALTFYGSTYSVNSASHFIIAGQTLNPGAAITVSGIPISLSPSQASNHIAIVGSSTQSLITSAPISPAAGPAVLTLDKSTYTANSASQFVIDGKTLTPGGLITVFGQPISEAPGGSFAVIGTSTQSLQTPAVTAPAALMTFAGSTYTANAASQFVIGGQTLTPGGAITISGTRISEGPSGSGVVVVGSSTQSLATATAAIIAAPALLTFNGATYTANSASQLVIGGQTLTAGGVITVSGTPISEAPSGSGLVVIGSSTQVLGHASMTTTSAAVMTFGGKTYTANTASEFVIDRQTLKPGSMITVSGTPISEAPGATDVVIGTSTEVLGTAAVTSSAMAFIGSGPKTEAPHMTSVLLWLGLSIFSGMFFLY